MLIRGDCSQACLNDQALRHETDMVEGFLINTPKTWPRQESCAFVVQSVYDVVSGTSVPPADVLLINEPFERKIALSRNLGLSRTPRAQEPAGKMGFASNTSSCGLSCSLKFSVPIIPNCFGMNGGDDGTRTRDLCRDRAAF